MKDNHGIEINEKIKNNYESATERMHASFVKSAFWQNVAGNLREFDHEYLLKSGYHLFVDSSEPEILQKPFKSFLLKTYRKNILENSGFPQPPEAGWMLPSNWFSRINDVLRTLFVVKYLDGVEFMIAKVECECKNSCKYFECSYEARDVGYYAVHLYTKQEFEIPKMDWDTVKVDVSIEIQLTTQLQEIIRKLLHTYYEQNRSMPAQTDRKWQWEYRSEEFGANYLGHILHYVEGMIMEIRERERPK